MLRCLNVACTSLVLLAFLLVGCGGSPSGNGVGNSTALSITAASNTVLLGKTIQFTANETVSSWTVNGIAAGSASVGTITTTGLYTAPGILPSAATITIGAISSGSSATFSLTITSDVTVTLTPSSIASPILTSSALNLTASITSAGAPNSAVTWTVDGISNGNAQIGTILPGANGAAVYTAPAVTPSASVQIAAISVADPSKSATLNLSVQAAQALAITIVGLQGAIAANVTVSGPNGYNAQVSSTQQLQVAPGTYSVVSSPVVSASSRYFPNVASESVTVSNAPVSVTVNYSTVVPNTTKVLDSVGMNSLAVSAAGSPITFSASSAVAATLAVGDVLVSGPTIAAPNGLLVKILSISTGNQTVTANVQPAALTDAIQQGTIQFSQVLGPTNTTPHLQQNLPPAAARRVANPRTSPSGACAGNSNTIQMPFNVPLTSDISLSGEDDICPTFSLNLDISSFTVVSMDAEVTLGLHTSLGLQATLQGSFNYPYSFKTLYAGPYVVLIGDVPVVLQPTLTPYLGLGGSASASAYTGLTTDSSLTIGASYANGVWGPIDTAVSPSVIGTTTSVDGKLSLKADAGLQAAVTFYGTATTTLSGDAYLQFDSNLNTNPCWVLTGGLEGTAGVSVSILGKALYDYTSPTLNIYSAPLLQATNTCFAPILTSVTPNSALLMGPATTIALVGSNFVPDSVVNFNGQAVTTTFVDPADLTAIVPAADLTVDGSFPITVTSPDSPGGTSAALPFAVNGVVVKVSPTTVSVPISKKQQFTATVTGTSNTAVIWTVNGVIGGNGTIGTIDSNGLYTAPSAVPSPASILIGALTQTQPAASGLANVTVTTGNYSFVFFSYPSAVSTSPASINDNGDIVGSYTTTSQREGFLYSNGVFSSIVHPPPSDPKSSIVQTVASGINNSGQIVGSIVISNAVTPGVSFIYSGGNFVDFTYPTAHSDIPQTVATGINNTGQIVGYYVQYPMIHGFIDSQGSFTTFDYPGATNTGPSAINDNGNIAGYYTNGSTIYDLQHGFILTNGSFAEITTPDEAGYGGSVNGINVADQAVVVTVGLDAYVYQNGTLTSFGVPGYRTVPTAINNKGQITGYYVDLNGNNVGFIATPQ